MRRDLGRSGVTVGPARAASRSSSGVIGAILFLLGVLALVFASTLTVASIVAFGILLAVGGLTELFRFAGRRGKTGSSSRSSPGSSPPWSAACWSSDLRSGSPAAVWSSGRGSCRPACSAASPRSSIATATGRGTLAMESSRCSSGFGSSPASPPPPRGSSAP
jgi:hypothetical protein